MSALGEAAGVAERIVGTHYWNPPQAAVLQECLWLVDCGAASPEAIDEVMRDGLARRWRLTGPFQTVGLGGAAVFDAIAANLFPELSAARSGRSFGPRVSCDATTLASLRAARDSELAAALRAERERDRTQLQERPRA